jgi:hypothetical protein
MAKAFRQLSSVSELQRGDEVRSKATGNRYTVGDNYGDMAVAWASAQVSDPSGWEVLREVAPGRARS